MLMVELQSGGQHATPKCHNGIWSPNEVEGLILYIWTQWEEMLRVQIGNWEWKVHTRDVKVMALTKIKEKSFNSLDG